MKDELHLLVVFLVNYRRFIGIISFVSRMFKCRNQSLAIHTHFKNRPHVISLYLNNS